jgi:hypothetical protein
MLYKRLLSILSTAVFAINAVPALPAAASDNTPSAVLSGQAETEKQLFAPGFDWERYGSATISVGQPQPNTADGYRGVCGTLSEPEIDFYLIWDWDGTRPKPAEKPVGTMSAEQCEYEIYRCEAGKSLLHPENKHVEYWSIPVENTVRKGMNINFWLSYHLEGWTNCGLPVGRLDTLAHFVAEKQEKGGYSVSIPADSAISGSFESGTPEQQPFRLKTGAMYDDFNWELYQTPEDGTAWVARNAANGITATWENIPAGGRTLFDCCKRMDADISRRYKFIHYDYTATADFTGNASVGVVALLADDLTASGRQSEVQIIDAWGETRPETDTKCGEITIEGIGYDVYETNISMVLGGSFEKVNRKQFRVIRKTNQKPKNPEDTYSASHNITDILSDLLQYHLDSYTLRYVSLFAEVENGSGTVNFTKNTPVQNEAETVAPAAEPADGYYWLPAHYGTELASEFAYQDNGRYTASWTNAYDVGCECGQTDFDMRGSSTLCYRYTADVNATGSVAVGVRCIFSNPSVSVFITDGMKGGMPRYFRKTGTEKIGSTMYDIWIYSAPASAGQTAGGPYWFVSQKNQLDAANGTVSQTVNLTDVMAVLKKCDPDLSLDHPERAGASFCAYDHSTGSVAFKENGFTDTASGTEPEKQQNIQNGDINCDGVIDVSDAVLLARFVAEDSTVVINEQGKAKADADRNGKVEADDVIHILRIIAKLI